MGQAPSRHEQIAAYTGQEVAALVKAGNLLVSTRESSRENLEIIAQHPEVKDRVMPWTKAVFLILSAGRGGMLAVSMSAPCEDGPPRDIPQLSSRQRKQWSDAAARHKDVYRIRHFDGACLSGRAGGWMDGWVVEWESRYIICFRTTHVLLLFLLVLLLLFFLCFIRSP